MSKFTLFIPHLLALRRRHFLLDAVEVIYRMEIYEIKARKVSHVEQSTEWKYEDGERRTDRYCR